MSRRELTADAKLEKLQHKSFSYFLHETNPDNGLVIDKNASDWPASIAATGFALAAYPVAVERGYMSRAAATERTLITLRFFWNSPQGPEPEATGYQGQIQPGLLVAANIMSRWKGHKHDNENPATCKTRGMAGPRNPLSESPGVATSEIFCGRSKTRGAHGS